MNKSHTSAWLGHPGPLKRSCFVGVLHREEHETSFVSTLLISALREAAAGNICHLLS